ncbi:unnamed protein product [Staurois parvus]|uniref:Uncharacterized protein n=1 Tax=Staurois parvus TaxID=386267 RepID=A0ABN9CLQ1_9NEOB|nr:unnamed protein product [Staurois parvus]
MRGPRGDRGRPDIVNIVNAGFWETRYSEYSECRVRGRPDIVNIVNAGFGETRYSEYSECRVRGDQI